MFIEYSLCARPSADPLGVLFFYVHIYLMRWVLVLSPFYKKLRSANKTWIWVQTLFYPTSESKFYDVPTLSGPWIELFFLLFSSDVFYIFYVYHWLRISHPNTQPVFPSSTAMTSAWGGAIVSCADFKYLQTGPEEAVFFLQTLIKD